MRYRVVSLIAVGLTLCVMAPAAHAKPDAKVQKAIDGGLQWVAHTQSRIGHWSAASNRYPSAVIAERSTT